MRDTHFCQPTGRQVSARALRTKMVIGIDIRNIGKKRTGDEAVFFNLVKQFSELDLENEYQLFTDITDHLRLAEIRERLALKDKPNFKIIPLKARNKFTWNLWTLPQYLRKNPVDIYQTQYIIPFFLPRKIKIVTIIHDISFKFFPQFIQKSDLFFLDILIPWSIRRADKVIGVSQFTRDEIIKAYSVSPKKVDYIYNALGEEFKKTSSPENDQQVKQKYQLPEKFIFYIGTLQPRKNIPFLIEGFSQLRKKIPGLKLVIAGERKAHNADQEITATLNQTESWDDVIFTGFIEQAEKPILYRLAALLAFPSRYEGFGIPLLEAWATETPVAASDIPVFREVAGEAAVYFDPTRVDSFVETVYNVWQSPQIKEALLVAGKKRLEFFEWKTSAEKMLSIYRELNRKN